LQPTGRRQLIFGRSCPETVRISYIDHSMFLIQTPGGLSVATDYNGFIGPTDFTPDVVTMIRQPH
jgi:hypothetical protein